MEKIGNFSAKAFRLPLDEIKYFYTLPQSARRLLLSYLLHGAASPLVTTFINSYIWRREGEILPIAFYNFGNYVALPIIFYINGILLKYIKINKLYILGSCSIALSSLLVIFFTKLDPIYYFLYGFVYGIGNGFYWANRNYITLKGTESGNRNYFIGITFSLDIITSVAVPFLIGWFLISGQSLGITSIESTYKLMVLISAVLLFFSGLTVYKGTYENPEFKNIMVKKTNGSWNGVRVLTLSMGITEGLAYYIPTILILSSIGHEGILGSIDSLLAVIGIVFTYLYGRKAKAKDRLRIFIFSILLSMVSAIILFINPGKIGIILYLILGYISGTYIWLSSDPMIMDKIDEIKNKFKISEYSLIFDREVFLNSGRGLGILIVMISIFLIPKNEVLKIVPFVAHITQIAIFILFWNLVRKVGSV